MKLTRQERRLLDLVAQGVPLKQAGPQIGLCYGTAKQYVHHACIVNCCTLYQLMFMLGQETAAANLQAMMERRSAA